MEPNTNFLITHDGVGHHPLGAGSYYFQNNLVSWLSAQMKEKRVNIFIGAQPNSSPHIGNICNISTAFALGQHLQNTGKNVTIVFDAVDTAPSPSQAGKLEINGVTYQKSLRWSQVDQTFLPQFQQILGVFSQVSSVPFRSRIQADILGSPESLGVLRSIISQHEELGALLSQKNGRIGVRASCPVAECGLADKSGINNRYSPNRIFFQCPIHGEFSINLHDSQEVAGLELNTPMRNLLRNRLFAADNSANWIQVVGADYAGFYQEQFLWRILQNKLSDKLPLIVYSPAILDWSGAKISKSLYVNQSAYQYLKNQNEFAYMLSFDRFSQSGFKLEYVYRVCWDWIDQPYKLFRAYTIYHLNDLLLATKEAWDSQNDGEQGDK